MVSLALLSFLGGEQLHPEYGTALLCIQMLQQAQEGPGVLGWALWMQGVGRV